MSSDEDDWNVNVRLGEIALKIETAKSRHSHVEYQTRWNIRARALKKILSGRKRLDAESHRSDETLQRFAYRFIVVDHEHHLSDVICHDWWTNETERPLLSASSLWPK